MRLDDIRKRLKDMNIMAVSRATNIHYNALYRIVNNISDPRQSTVEKLINYFERKQNG